MPPNLRKRVWYQRYLGCDELAHHPNLFRKQMCLDLLNNINKDSSNFNSRQWNYHWQQSQGDDTKDNDNLRTKVKEEVVDDQQVDKKDVIPPVNGPGKGRMLLRDWLEVNANDGGMSGLKWLDKGHGLVQISWKHGSRAGWSRSDAEVFESWALHTGKFNPNKSDWKRWKANFRCALNSLSDVIEIKEIGNTRSSDPYKVYRLLPTHDTCKQMKSKRVKPTKMVQPKLLSESNKLDVEIKMESIDPDDAFRSSNAKSREQIEAFSSVSFVNEIKFSSSEKSMGKDRAYDHHTSHLPIHLADFTLAGGRHAENETNYRFHNDHSYANTSKHLAADKELVIEPEPFDCYDLVSTINEEFEKFCASNIYMDLWSEEMRIDKDDFALHDFNISSYFDK